MINTDGDVNASVDVRLLNDEPESESLTGFIVKRRRLLWLPVWTAAALLFTRPTTLLAQGSSTMQNSGVKPETGRGTPTMKEGGLDWDEFLKQAVPVTKELIQEASPAGYDAYLYSLASFAGRLRLQTIPRAKLGAFGSLNPPVHFGVGYRGVPFIVVEWWMEPNAVLPPHNHPNYSVCTLGIEGEARIRHFEVVGAAPDFASTNAFRVRETHDDLISAGRISSLSPTRDNIHTFQAGKKGARGIDITTPHGSDVGSSFLHIEDGPNDQENRIYKAVWRKL